MPLPNTMETTNNPRRRPELQFTPLIRDPEETQMDPSIPTATSALVLQRNFTDEQLIDHLKTLGQRDDCPLGRFIRGWTDIVNRTALEHLSRRELHHFPFSNLEVFESGSVSSILNVMRVSSSGLSVSDRSLVGSVSAASSSVASLGTLEDPWSPLKVWKALKHVNPSKESAGRITILQEPTPLMLGAIHLSMRQNFDTDELLRLVVDNKGGQVVGKSEARVLNRCYSPHPLRQRSFVFVLRYYTCVAEGIEPPPWHLHSNIHGPVARRRYDHIDLAECRSVLALSLEGAAIKRARHEQPTRIRRDTLNKPNHQSSGSIYDTFAPWHLLHIQSFPDDEHSCMTPIANGTTRFVNGPYAFFFRLADEFRDAVKRNHILHARITNLVIPPTDWLFDQHLREKLLFEDNYLTYTRRYFWAFNALRSITQSIESMVAAYRQTFTDQIWDGRHPEIWPHSAPDSPQGQHYRDQLSPIRQGIEQAIQNLINIQKKNEQTRQEIIILREQLMAGSTIKESRRSIERGDNMKMLTSISVIFLPLTFVTSIFGMTEFHIAPTEWQFPATMVMVCIPVIFFVLLVQTVSGMGLVKRFVRDRLGIKGGGRERIRSPPYRYCVDDQWYSGSPGRLGLEERVRGWNSRMWEWGDVFEREERQRQEVGDGIHGLGKDERIADSSSKSMWYRWRLGSKVTSSGGGDTPECSGNIA